MRHWGSKLVVSGIALQVAAGPRPAFAAVAEADAFGWGAALVLVVIIAAFLLWLQRKNALLQVESAPIGFFRINRNGLTGSALGRDLLGLEGPLTTDSLSAAFVATDSTLIAQAMEALRTTGAPFDGRFRTNGGRSVSVVGRRAGRNDVIWVSDIDERAQLAADLAIQSDERTMLRQILDKLPMPIWWRSDSLEIAGCNAAYAEACDTDPDTATAQGRELAAGYLDRDGRGLARRAQKSGSVQSESHHIVIGGTRRLLEFTEAAVSNASTATVGFATDVTMIEAVQSELASLVAAHAEVLETLGAAIAIYGPDRRLKFFNSAFLDLWRVDSATLSGEPSMGEVLDKLRDRRRLPEFVDFPAFKQESDALFHSLIDSREELLHLPDERTLRMVVAPHPMGGLLFVYEDVTDRLALERSYNTSIAVQRETINNLHEAIAVFGADGRLRLSNPAAATMWNLASDEALIDAHIGDLLEQTRRYFPQSDDWDQRKQKLVLAITEPEPKSGRLERNDGQVIDFSCVPLPDGGCLLGYTDVTDSVRVQRALEERNLALQHADRLRSDFIANVSYELRTPLNAIIGFTEILENQYFGDLNERQSGYVEGILRATNHLMALINDILDLATIEAGYMELELAPLDVSEALANLLNAFRNRASDSKLSLEFDCPDDIGAIVADEKRLRQAIYNLVTNAVQFTPEGGTITLSARRETDYLSIAVADTGVGFPESEVERLFSKFERGDQGARESGAGLGLALVKSLIELHGGGIHVESEVGKGTRIECRLPFAAQTPLQHDYPEQNRA